MTFRGERRFLSLFFFHPSNRALATAQTLPYYFVTSNRM